MGSRIFPVLARRVRAAARCAWKNPIKTTPPFFTSRKLVALGSFPSGFLGLLHLGKSTGALEREFGLN